MGEMVRGKGGIFIEMARELAVKMILEIFSDNETNFELCTNSGGVVGNGGEIGWIGRGRRTSRRRAVGMGPGGEDAYAGEDGDDEEEGGGDGGGEGSGGGG